MKSFQKLFHYTSEGVLIGGWSPHRNKNSKFDKIVYKSSGGADVGSAQKSLRSQIPGKVVSIEVKVGDKVKKGDVVCVLESMKMQVSVKSHKDGEIKILKTKEGNSVNKNDILAEIE